MRDVRDALDRMQPTPEARGDWDAVLRDANVRRRSGFVRPIAAFAAAASALFALALLQPWEGEGPTVLERALAAVDDGPVLHAVLRGEWGGTLVNLETGSRKPVHGENEFWYDPDRNLVHQISRLGDAVQFEHVYKPKEPPPDLFALTQEYRQALESGTARLAGEGVVDDIDVYWITIRSRMDLDVADGKLHGWTEQIAVSRETYKPVALRDTRDGKPVPMTGRRVLELEMLPAGDGDFSGPRNSPFHGLAFSYQPFAGTLSAAEAEEVLGRRPLWSGPRVGKLELARLGLTEMRSFRVRQVKKKNGVVLVRGPRVEVDSARGIVLFYGEIGDNPDTYREDVGPLWDRPHVAITETSRPSFGSRELGGYVPPEGSLFLAAGGRGGLLEVGGVYVRIAAPSEELVLSAARALEPMPG
jgi:hypothetical protein